MPGCAAPPPDHRHTPGRRTYPATAVQTKTPRSLPRRGTPFGILSATAPWPSDVLSQPLMAAQSGQDTTSRLAWDNAISHACDVWLKAREAGALQTQQLDKAQKAEMLMRGLAHIGIIALVDEATGYQEIRDRLALQAILDAYLRKELAAW